MNSERAEGDMKVGDYVAKITNEWQKHNKWMEFHDEVPEPLGIIVKEGMWLATTTRDNSWVVMKSNGVIISIGENMLKVINETK